MTNNLIEASGDVTTTSDRRHGHRLDRPEAHGLASARIRPGYDVEVLDVSTGGLLVEGSHPMMPGTPVELYLRFHVRPTVLVRGQVIRCSVARLSATDIVYRGAIAFDHELRTAAPTSDLDSEFKSLADRTRSEMPGCLRARCLETSQDNASAPVTNQG